MEPTTGVYSGNDIAWEFVDNGHWIDLDLEDAIAELEATGASEEEIEELTEYWESGDTQLYGDWMQDEDGQYIANPDGEFAMIYNVNHNTVQAVWSKTIRYGRPASPCYPGQVDAQIDDPEAPEGEEIGHFEIGAQLCSHYRNRGAAYYALPAWALREE